MMNEEDNAPHDKTQKHVAPFSVWCGQKHWQDEEKICTHKL
jgi:hypothetical protein